MARRALESAEADEPKRRRHIGRTVLIILLVLVLLAVAFIGLYFLRVNSALDNLNRREGLLPTETQEKPAGSPITYVLMGSDSRGEGDQGRSDVLMALYVSGDKNDIYLISFPRDMWVPIPEHGEAKINAAYAWGGPPLTVQTLNDLLGMSMDHVVEIDFEGFKDLTNELGGVTVYNEHSSASDGFTFPEGNITIQGDEALAYVRERYDLPRGDFDRAERQRNVVRAIIAKVVTPQVIANPIKTGEVIDSFAPYVTVDEGITNAHVLEIAKDLGISGKDSIHSIQAPVSGTGTSADGQSIDIVDWDTLSEMAQAMRDDEMDAYLANHPQ